MDFGGNIVAVPPLKPVAYRVVICTAERAPLFEEPRLARIAAQMPDMAPTTTIDPLEITPSRVRATIHTGKLSRLNRIVENYKIQSETQLVDSIKRFYGKDLLDAIMRYNPVWSSVIYRIWEDGYHRQPIFCDESSIKLNKLHGIL